jgi:hypothetical protein
VRIRYPSAAFDVPVHRFDVDAAAQASQTVEPPATKDGYWLTPFGTPGLGSANTTYVIGHSWEGADAPFNHLSSAAAVGDRFEVDTATGTIPYQVDSVTTYLKSSLKDSPIWRHAKPVGADQLLHRGPLGHERGGHGVAGGVTTQQKPCSRTSSGLKMSYDIRSVQRHFALAGWHRTEATS